MKILLACGGTGGHIFPAFSVAEELKRRDPACEILYVCGKKDIEDAIFKMVKDEKVFSVTSAPFTGRSSLWNPVFLIKLFRGICQSAALLVRERPGAVVGFGGYFSFPVMLAAKLLGIPALVHEQNVVPGVANRFLSRFVDGVALSFEETGRYLPRSKGVRTTGNPIRSSIETSDRPPNADRARQWFSTRLCAMRRSQCLNLCSAFNCAIPLNALTNTSWVRSSAVASSRTRK